VKVSMKERQVLVTECRSSCMKAKTRCNKVEPRRKGWLFSDTKKGAKSSAVVYSMVEAAKANQLNVYMYLVHIFNTKKINNCVPPRGN